MRRHSKNSQLLPSPRLYILLLPSSPPSYILPLLWYVNTFFLPYKYTLDKIYSRVIHTYIQMVYSISICTCKFWLPRSNVLLLRILKDIDVALKMAKYIHPAIYLLSSRRAMKIHMRRGRGSACAIATGNPQLLCSRKHIKGKLCRSDSLCSSSQISNMLLLF